MIEFVYANTMAKNHPLKTSMFRDRASQFRDRLKWAVTVNEEGEERDEYDEMNPLYVIWRQNDGTHGGSMRILPTTSGCMVNDHFKHLTDGVEIRSPLIWECTRFCLAKDSGTSVAAALMLAGGELMRGFGIEHFVGVFDRRMERIYKRIGASPTIISSSSTGAEGISVGLWEYDPSTHAQVARGAGISLSQSRSWFERSFGTVADSSGRLAKAA